MFSHKTAEVVYLNIESIDSDTQKKFYDELKETVKFDEKKIHLILDMSQIHFISSSGAGKLIQIYKKIKRKGGTLQLANLSPRMGNAMMLFGLQKLCKISVQVVDPNEPSQ